MSRKTKKAEHVDNGKVTVAFLRELANRNRHPARAGEGRDPNSAASMVARRFKRDKNYGRPLKLSDEVRTRGGAKSRRRTCRVWK